MQGASAARQDPTNSGRSGSSSIAVTGHATAMMTDSVDEKRGTLYSRLMNINDAFPP